jgi:hypothetical protein
MWKRYLFSLAKVIALTNPERCNAAEYGPGDTFATYRELYLSEADAHDKGFVDSLTKDTKLMILLVRDDVRRLLHTSVSLACHQLQTTRTLFATHLLSSKYPSHSSLTLASRQWPYYPSLSRSPTPIPNFLSPNP